MTDLPFSRYAEVYDDTNQIAFSLKMLPYLDQVLERYGVQVTSALDLACGTGTVAISFAARGWSTYAVDVAPAMLTEARRKAAEAGVTVAFSQQDMRSFVVPGPLDLVTCLYDSMNYLLSEDDLRLTCQRVAKTLRPGGLFLFDLNTPWALEHGWGDSTLYLEYERACLVFRSRYDAQQRQMEAIITGFVRRGELYEKFEERHVERGYTEEEVRRVATNSGLQTLACYECFSFDPPSPTSSRLFWVLTKPATPANQER